MISGFTSISASDAEVLILGSMPGIASLEATEYYAHPRNAFWPIMQELFGINRSLDYSKRCSALKKQKVSIWDVLARCERQGSLDSAIQSATQELNDFSAFFSAHPNIKSIYLNGGAATKLFQRHVWPELHKQSKITMTALPSTSPANASWSFERKLEAWRVITEQ